MVLSSLGNFSGWSCIYISIIIHQVSKSSPGFPSNLFGSLILICFANWSSWILLCLLLIGGVFPLLPWSEGGPETGGGGSPAPLAAPPVAPPDYGSTGCSTSGSSSGYIGCSTGGFITCCATSDSSYPGNLTLSVSQTGCIASKISLSFWVHSSRWSSL